MKSAYIGAKRLELAGRFASCDELIKFLKSAYTADGLKIEGVTVYGSTASKLIVNKLDEENTKQ